MPLICKVAARCGPNMVSTRQEEERKAEEFHEARYHNRHKVGRSWEEIERMAQDRRGWRSVVGGLCTVRV